MTLAQIAWLLGYERPMAFNRDFKRWTGRSPSAVRNQTARHHLTVPAIVTDVEMNRGLDGKLRDSSTIEVV